MRTEPFARPDGRKLNLEVIRYSGLNSPRNRWPGHHRHQFHSIYYFEKGRSIQEIDFERYEMAGPSVLVIPKGAIHWEIESQELAGYVILFTDEFFSEVQRELLHSFMQYAIALRKLWFEVSASEKGHLIDYFRLLQVEEQVEGNQNQTFLLQNLMLALLNKLEGLIQHIPEQGSFIEKRQPFQRFIALVERHYLEHQSLEFYTGKLQITSRKLNSILKELTGQTAGNYLIDRVMVEAKRQLCFSDKSVKEISYQLGYENPYYFSRLFKRRTEVSPEQFRQCYAE